MKARRAVIPLFIPHEGCPHACSFCDQRAISGESEMTPEKAAAELERAFASFQPAEAEIAFFGGSFTCLEREKMLRYLEVAKPYLDRGQAASLRCSTRPDGISPEILPVLRRYRMETVELGAQSFSDRVLMQNGRGHRAADIERAFSLLREGGFTVGLQIMTGLPGETEEDLEKTVEAVLRLHPDMLRVYPTVVIRGTPMARWMEEGRFIPKGVEESVPICAGILTRMERAGIPVIRMGLHPSAELEEKVVGGCYHPAFKELCLARIWRDRGEDALTRYPAGTEVRIFVPKGQLSQAMGQRKGNLAYWEKLGYRVQVCPSEDGQSFLAVGETVEPLK